MTIAGRAGDRGSLGGGPEGAIQMVITKRALPRRTRFAAGRGGPRARVPEITRGPARLWLTGVHPKRTQGADVRGAKTIDQMAADELGRDTPLRSLEVAAEDFTAVGGCDIGYSCSYVNTLSWRTATRPLPMQTDPRVVFERLFGEGLGAEERRRQLGRDRSILDAIVGRGESTSGAARRCRHRARGRVPSTASATWSSVSGRWRRASASTSSCPRCRSGVPELYDDHVKLIVRPAGAGVPDRRHARQHVHARARGVDADLQPHRRSRSAPRHLAPRQRARQGARSTRRSTRTDVSLFRYFLDRAARHAGRRTARCWIMRCCSTAVAASSNGNLHLHTDLPVLLAGGERAASSRAGRHVACVGRLPPLTNLLLSSTRWTSTATEAAADADRHRARRLRAPEVGRGPRSPR